MSHIDFSTGTCIGKKKNDLNNINSLRKRKFANSKEFD